MNGYSKKTAAAFLALLPCFIQGCSQLGLDKVLPDKRDKYQASTSLPDLEVPPDLTLDTADDVMLVPGDGQAMTLTEYERQRALYGSGQNISDSFFTVGGTVEGLWPKLTGFWTGKDFSLELDDLELGIIETAWQEDTRQDEEQSKYRYRFRVFVEAIDDQQEIVRILLSSETEEWLDASWQPTEDAPGVVSELVGTFNNHVRELPDGDRIANRQTNTEADNMGAASEGVTIAEQPEATTMEPTEDAAMNGAEPPRPERLEANNGRSYLVLPERFDASWSRIGDILQQNNSLSIEKMEQDSGQYWIRFDTPPDEQTGLLKKLKFWERRKTEQGLFIVGLTEVGDSTELIVLDETNEWASNKTIDRFLTQIIESW